MWRRGEWSLLAVSTCVLAIVLANAGCKSGRQTPHGDGGHEDGEIDRPGDSGGTENPDAPATSDAVTDSRPDSDSATGSTPAAVCRAAIEAQCRRHAVCRNADFDACVATVVDRCPTYYFNPRSLRTVAEIESCLPALGSMTCTDIAMGLVPACLRLGTGAAGSPCLYATECEFGCAESFDECGTCYALTWAATGAACDSTHRCATTDYCHTVSKTCAPKASVVYAAEGEPCDFAAQPSVGCQGDLVCARTSTTGTAGICRPIPQLDQPCAISGDTIGGGQICRPGLACDTKTMTCRPPPPSGGCGDGGACDNTSFCRDAFSSAATCVPRAPEGQACRIGATTAGPELQCAVGVRCALTPDAGYNGNCVKPGAIGDACDVTHPCAASLCGVTGRCTAYDVAGCQPGGAP